MARKWLVVPPPDYEWPGRALNVAACPGRGHVPPLYGRLCRRRQNEAVPKDPPVSAARGPRARLEASRRITAAARHGRQKEPMGDKAPAPEPIQWLGDAIGGSDLLGGKAAS